MVLDLLAAAFWIRPVNAALAKWAVLGRAPKIDRLGRPRGVKLGRNAVPVPLNRKDKLRDGVSSFFWMHIGLENERYGLACPSGGDRPLADAFWRRPVGRLNTTAAGLSKRPKRAFSDSVQWTRKEDREGELVEPGGPTVFKVVFGPS